MTEKRTPWKIHKDINWQVVKDSPTLELVAQAFGSDDEKEDNENAKHIVHCVNMHTDLVEALKFYANEDNYDHEGAPFKMVTSHESVHEIFDCDMGDLARKALLKATKEG